MRKKIQVAQKTMSEWRIIFSVPLDIVEPYKKFRKTFTSGNQALAIATLVRFSLIMLGYMEHDVAVSNILRTRLLELGWKEPDTCEAEYEQAA